MTNNPNEPLGKYLLVKAYPHKGIYDSGHWADGKVFPSRFSADTMPEINEYIARFPDIDFVIYRRLSP
jgi:hypothetical protein